MMEGDDEREIAVSPAPTFNDYANSIRAWPR